MTCMELPIGTTEYDFKEFVFDATLEANTVAITHNKCVVVVANYPLLFIESHEFDSASSRDRFLDYMTSKGQPGTEVYNIGQDILDPIQQEQIDWEQGMVSVVHNA